MKPVHIGKIFLAVALLAWLPSALFAAEIRGTITVAGSGGPTRADMNPHAGGLGSLVQERPPSSAGAQDVVIYVDGVRPPEEDRDKHYEMALKGQMFSPRVLGVSVGSTVDFPNQDPVFHNVFSYSRTKRFDLGRYGKNKSKGVRFDRPGLVKVFCEIHSNSSAFVYVVDGAVITQPDANGRFKLRGVPEGTHELVIWHPEKGERRMKIDMGNETLKLDLTI